MTRRQVAIAGVISAVPIAVAIFIVVGHYAAVRPATFEWSSASAAGTAAGTLALALVTGILAVLTSEDVQLTRAIETERDRPTLVARKFELVEVALQGGVLRGKLQIEIENVGLGPAITVNVGATYPTPDVVVDGNATIYAIGPGLIGVSVANIPFSVTSSDPEKRPRDPNPRAFHLVVECLDRTLTPVANPLVEPGYEEP